MFEGAYFIISVIIYTIIVLSPIGWKVYDFLGHDLSCIVFFFVGCIIVFVPIVVRFSLRMRDTQ